MLILKCLKCNTDKYGPKWTLGNLYVGDLQRTGKRGRVIGLYSDDDLARGSYDRLCERNVQPYSLYEHEPGKFGFSAGNDDVLFVILE